MVNVSETKKLSSANELANDIQQVLENARNEHKLSYYEVVGVVEVISANLLLDALNANNP